MRAAIYLCWSALWLNSQQQAYKTLQEGVQAYRAKDYQAAVELFLTQPSNIEAIYNAGNAYALAGKYQKAIAMYRSVLQQNPQHQDAAYNLKILEELLKNQSPKPQPQSKPKQQPQPQPTKHTEQQQMQQQWLKLVPDEPGGLLRQKFLRDYLRRHPR